MKRYLTDVFVLLFSAVFVLCLVLLLQAPISNLLAERGIGTTPTNQSSIGSQRPLGQPINPQLGLAGPVAYGVRPIAQYSNGNFVQPFNRKIEGKIRVGYTSDFDTKDLTVAVQLLKPNEVIELGSGTFALRGDFYRNSGEVRIVGSGSSTIAVGGTIRYVASFNNLTIDGQGKNTAITVSANSVTFKDVTIQGGAINALSIEGNSQVLGDNLTVEGSSMSCVQMPQSGTLVIKKSHFAKCRTGIEVGYATRVSVQDSEFKDLEFAFFGTSIRSPTNMQCRHCQFRSVNKIVNDGAQVDLQD